MRFLIFLSLLLCPLLSKAQTAEQQEILDMLREQIHMTDVQFTRLFDMDRQREIRLWKLLNKNGIDADSLLSAPLPDMLPDSLVMAFPPGYLTNAQKTALGISLTATGIQRINLILGKAQDGTWWLDGPGTNKWRVMGRSTESFVVKNFGGVDVTFLIDRANPVFGPNAPESVRAYSAAYRDVRDVAGWERHPVILSYDPPQ